MILAIVYALFLLYAILRLFRRPTEDAVDYIIAGRRLTLPAFVATLVTTWYGGILGVGEYTWRYGVSNWLVFGVPYYIYALVFAFLLAARARRSRVLTVPDQIEQRFGRGPALVAAGTLFVMTAPSAYVLMIGVLVGYATGWPLWIGVVLGTALSVGYVFRGGLRAIVGTDKVQFCLMFLAFVVLVPACLHRYGGWQYLRDALPAQHLEWDGGRGFQAVAVWYVLALSTLVEPAFYQRCFAARDERTARTGIFIAVGFWICFDFLTTIAGLYARAVLPELADPLTAFPALAELTLSPVWRGLFTVGLLATIMSTIDSYSFICAVTFGRDLVQRWRAPGGKAFGAGGGDDGSAADEVSDLCFIRWSLLLTAVVAITLALWARSVIDLWHDLGSMGTPVLLFPLVLGQTRLRIGGGAVLGSMLGAGAVAGGWLLAGGGEPWLGIEAIFPGLAVSALWLAAGWRLEEARRKKHCRSD